MKLVLESGFSSRNEIIGMTKDSRKLELWYNVLKVNSTEEHKQ